MRSGTRLEADGEPEAKRATVSHPFAKNAKEWHPLLVGQGLGIARGD